MRPVSWVKKSGSHICDPYTNKFSLSGFFNGPLKGGVNFLSRGEWLLGVNDESTGKEKSST